MWDLSSRPGTEPATPVLEGEVLATEHQASPSRFTDMKKAPLQEVPVLKHCVLCVC